MEEFTTPVQELLDVQGGLSDLPKAVAVCALEHSLEFCRQELLNSHLIPHLEGNGGGAEEERSLHCTMSDSPGRCAVASLLSMAW